MIGDVNLFFSEDDDHVKQAECEVMIAEPSHRRQGLAKLAMTLMIRYAAAHLGPLRFFSRIGLSNDASLALFASLGFDRYKTVAVFNECELRLTSIESLPKPSYSEEDYDRSLSPLKNSSSTVPKNPLLFFIPPSSE